MYDGSPTITDILIAMLSSARNTYRFKQILREREFQRFKEQSIRGGLSRLRNKGYVSNSRNGWQITRKGIVKYNRDRIFDYFPSPFPEKSQKNTIVSFDVPETKRIVRNWLRNQLKVYGYTMLQKSLWIGPGPLPEKFKSRLEKLGVRKNVKIFRVKMAR